MVYMLATIKLRPGKLQQFNTLLSHLVPIFEERGWKLPGGYLNTIGRLNSVVDLWQLPDANAVQSVLMQASQDPEFQKWAPQIDECVEDETLQIMTKLPYSP